MDKEDFLKTKEFPKIRWWLPGCMVDKSEIIREIHMLKEGGFAGAEISPMKTYHPGLGYIQQGWGQDDWYEILTDILKEAKALEFEIDLMIMCSSALALSFIKDVNDPTQGARMELDGAYIDGITAEHPYMGPLPLSEEALQDALKVNGKVELFAVTVAKYIDKEKRILSLASAQELDLSTQIVKNGEDYGSYTVNFTPEDAGEYVLFAWWLHPSGEIVSGMPQMDIYGEYGTARFIEYYEKNIFPRLGDAKNHITSLFIDSLECGTHLDFTRGMRERFVERNGYDIVKYFPALYEKNWGGTFRNPNPDFHFDSGNEQLMNSYGEILTELYIENHVRPLKDFCEKHGMQLRYQTSYGKFLELGRTAEEVDIPDTETLYGKDIIDFYRIQAGAAHITGKRLYSVEASAEKPGRGNGDENSGNYTQGLKNHLWHIQRAFAGGVNQVYFHGCRYRGHYNGIGNEAGAVPGTHWPGYEPMDYLGGWSNSWDDRQPNWNTIRQLNTYLARCQYILRKGQQKVELAIYHHSYMETIDCLGARKLFDSVILEQQGYSYDFISPVHLLEDGIELDGNCIFPKGPAYKALIIYRQKLLPAEVIGKLLRLAKNGFPIVFCEGIPKEAAFFGNGDIRENMEKLLLQKNVRVCNAAEQLPAILRELGAEPDVSYEKTTKVLNVHRRAEEADYVYFYAYADADTFPELENAEKIQFRTEIRAEGKPYFMDPWNGNIKEIPYEKTEKGISLTLELAPNDSCILAVAHESTKGEVLETAAVQKKESCLELKNWTLEVESWTAGKTAFETEKKVIRTVELEEPVYWTRLEGMESVSGIGYYKTEFNLGEHWKPGTGATLFLPDIEDSYILKVNGVEVMANQIDPMIEIGEWLRPGKNQLEIAVTSTLLNAVIAYCGKNGYEVKGKYRDYGMAGAVKLLVYGDTD